MLKADNVAESLQCDSRKPEVTKLPITIQIGRIENDMVMNMSPIHMSCNDKSVFSFCESHSSFIPDLICFFRCDLSRFERLADLIGDHLMLLPPTGDLLILTLGQHKLLVHGHRVTLIAGDQFTLFGLFRILCIIRSVAQTLGNGFSLVHMQGNESCCCHGHLLLSQILA